ncbi:MAG: nucleotide sugar dehydrogenase, partial [Armatimonadetes bacterium]|nr:nucleotide sugar dehydrogenase [Armatimonadota bacterium]
LGTPIRFTSDPADLVGITFFVVAVPTPIDSQKRPDLNPLITASEIVGKAMQSGAVVVYESTVYPGVTEEICGPVLERVSGLRQGVDFKLGYSPERINPGDKEHTLEKIMKVVSGEDEETLNRVSNVYSRIIAAGLHRAPSIKVAEAAKVIENTQRDLNIALMNELAIIFNRLGIRTKDVLDAARTKWNFLPFMPGLVGGHCIGVDPYYLTMKAEEIGYYPQVILAGRRINDGMGTYLADQMVKLLIHANLSVKGARVAVLGITFKENVNDLRNSQVPSIVNELRQFGIDPMVHDPVADPCLAEQKYGLKLAPWHDLSELDGLVLAVSHQHYLEMELSDLIGGLRTGGVLMDVKSVLKPALIPGHISYWSL